MTLCVCVFAVTMFCLCGNVSVCPLQPTPTPTSAGSPSSPPTSLRFRSLVSAMSGSVAPSAPAPPLLSTLKSLLSRAAPPAQEPAPKEQHAQEQQRSLLSLLQARPQSQQDKADEPYVSPPYSQRVEAPEQFVGAILSPPAAAEDGGVTEQEVDEGMPPLPLAPTPDVISPSFANAKLFAPGELLQSPSVRGDAQADVLSEAQSPPQVSQGRGLQLPVPLPPMQSLPALMALQPPQQSSSSEVCAWY